MESLATTWNYADEIGQIEPPLTDEEAAALQQQEVYPDTMIRYGEHEDLARTALIKCPHIRVAGRPGLTAEVMAAFK